ncbi:MAG: hypothetical protein AAFR96_11495 [Planctomycetota bacterium]
MTRIRARLALAITFAIAAACAAGTLAAPQPDDAPAEPTVFADFGLGGIPIASEWAPVDIIVQAIDNPLSGIIEVSYRAGGETITHVAPFAVAPNAVATIPLAVRLPWWTDDVTVSAIDRDRGRVAQTTYRSSPGPTDARLPVMSTPDTLCIVATPRLSEDIAQVNIAAEEPSPGDDQDQPATKPEFRSVLAAAVHPGDIPASRLALAAADLIIIDAADLGAVQPRSVDGLRRWTAAGGRLVILTDQPGNEWNSFLADAPAARDIQLGTAIAMTRSGQATAGRTIALGPIARAAGWMPQLTNDTGQTVAATGTYGLGIVTLLAVPPEALGVLSSRGPTPDLAALLSLASADGPGPIVEGVRQSGGLDPRSVSRRGTDWILLRSLDAVASTTPPGVEAFIIIAAVPIALAVLLGPVDYIALGLLRRRHAAWLSAMAWIILVGAAALLIPRSMQTGKADIGSISTIDAIMPNAALPADAPASAAAELPPPLAAWSADAALLFHASRDEFTLTPGLRAWRPLNTGGIGGAPVAGTVFAHTPAGPGLTAAAAINPARIPPRTWSLATLRAQGPVDHGFRASLTGEQADGPLVLRFDASPSAGSEARILAAQVSVDGKRFVWKGNRSGDAYLCEPAGESDQPLLAGRNEEITRAAAALLIDEPTRRQPALNALARAGWARLDILIADPPSAPAFQTAADTERSAFALVRAAIPTAAADAAPTENAP